MSAPTPRKSEGALRACKLDPHLEQVKRLAATPGVTRVDIAARFGVNESSVRRFLKKHGLSTTRPDLPVVETVGTGEVSELEILRQENAELRKAISTVRADDVREARVVAALKDAIPGKAPRYRPAPAPNRSKKHAHSLVLLWSDLHAAEVVSSEETNGANKYDWDTMLRRHDELRRGVLSFAERFEPVDELVILGLGDLLSGSIHEELAETNEMPMSDAIVQMGLDGAEFIESFVEHFPKVRFSGVVGNHGRFTKKPRAKTKFDNADYLAYQVMRQRLARLPVDFEVPRPQQHPVMVKGRRLLMMHGDGVRSSMVGVPWGGIIRHCGRLANQYALQGLPVDHFVAGHYHEGNVVSNRRILINGSVKGLDEYSLHAYGGGCAPAQLLAPFHQEWGLVGVHFIDLDPSQIRVA